MGTAFGFHVEDDLTLSGLNQPLGDTVLVRRWEVIKEVNGIKHVYAELIVNDSNDLPNADSFSGYHLYMGSLAVMVKNGSTVRMDKDGSWHQQVSYSI